MERAGLCAWVAAYSSEPAANPCDTGLMSIPPKLATARVLLDDYPGGDAVLSWVRRFKTDERHVAIARRVVFDIA